MGIIVTRQTVIRNLPPFPESGRVMVYSVWCTLSPHGHPSSLKFLLHELLHVPPLLPRVIGTRDGVDLRFLLNQRTMTGMAKDTPKIGKKRAPYPTGRDWRGLVVLKVAKGIGEDLNDDAGKGTLYNVQVSHQEKGDDLMNPVLNHEGVSAL